jgi:hypothetical protein|tara:strand:- start:1252 stop:1422 length:171 start_codon:yes stop_codon:yes gene_type:complete
MKITAKAMRTMEPLIGDTKYVPPSSGLMYKGKPKENKDTEHIAIAGYIRNIRKKRS